jgi:inosine-uridine nucleoside N-ribohydrolase
VSKIPVILDTDIGGDIDDTWALVMMLKCPELDPKLIVTDTGDTVYRAKVVAKVLQAAGRTDIPIGIGIRFATDHGSAPQADYVRDYDLADYPGTIHEDGVQAITDTIMNSEEEVTLICIGPVPNIGEALRREPHIAQGARFVGMHGSVRKGYGDSADPVAECNVVHHTPDCQEVFAAPWRKTITPLDTCGLVQLDGERYARVAACEDPAVQALMENYRIWKPGWEGAGHVHDRSSTLFDTVAVYLAFSDDLLDMERLPIRVTDDGFTRIEEGAPECRVATEWKDMEAFLDLLTERLTT